VISGGGEIIATDRDGRLSTSSPEGSNSVTIIRVGATKKYSDGWESAFGNVKKSAPAQAAKKSSGKKAAVKSATAKAAVKSAKKKPPAKKGKK
jgi:hypothetical protein